MILQGYHESGSNGTQTNRPSLWISFTGPEPLFVFLFFLYGSITLNPLASQLGCSSPAGISGKVHNMLCEQGICFKAHTHTCKFALEGQKLRVTSPPRCWQPNPNVHPPVPTARLLRSAELRLEWESGRFCMRKRHFLG